MTCEQDLIGSILNVGGVDLIGSILNVGRMELIGSILHGGLVVLVGSILHGGVDLIGSILHGGVDLIGSILNDGLVDLIGLLPNRIACSHSSYQLQCSCHMYLFPLLPCTATLLFHLLALPFPLRHYTVALLHAILCRAAEDVCISPVC